MKSWRGVTCGTFVETRNAYKTLRFNNSRGRVRLKELDVNAMIILKYHYEYGNMTNGLA
jgi:hypothetical protein